MFRISSLVFKKKKFPFTPKNSKKVNNKIIASETPFACLEEEYDNDTDGNLTFFMEKFHNSQKVGKLEEAEDYFKNASTNLSQLENQFNFPTEKTPKVHRYVQIHKDGSFTTNLSRNDAAEIVEDLLAYYSHESGFSREVDVDPVEVENWLDWVDKQRAKRLEKANKLDE